MLTLLLLIFQAASLLKMLVYLISGIIIGTVLTIIFRSLFYLYDKQTKAKKKLILFPKKRQVSSFQALGGQKETVVELKNKLIKMVGGELEEAERLVARARFGDSGKSETYYWWKAIKKFERQRIDNDKSKKSKNI